MIDVVYLVLVMHVGGSSSRALTNVTIPQANMAQCQVNLKNYGNAEKVTSSYCIVGVMPK